MKDRRAIVGLFVFGAALAASGRAADLEIYDSDTFPLIEKSVLRQRSGEQSEVLASRVSALMGWFDWTQRPDWVKIRVAPIVYFHSQNEHEFRPILIGGLKFAAWRSKNDDPYFSGGFKALFGAVVADYGYRAPDNSRYRAWQLTPALVYENNETHGRRFVSLDGWIFAANWANPTQPATKNISLLKNCLAYGKRDGKAYGRLLWVPLGPAPPLFPKGAPTEKAGETPAKKKQPPPSRKRVEV